MNRNIKTIIVYFLLIILTPSFAGAVDFLTTDGGVTLSSKDRDYWFKISGTLKVDERVYWGDTAGTALRSATPVSGVNSTAGTYDSGASVRDAGLTFEGGVGKDWTYNIALNFDVNKGASRIDDAYVTYHGFKDCLPNFTFDIGQVIPGFCLNCASSSKWIPFLERNMGTNTFGPEQGMGINFNSFNTHYTANFTITQQPKTGEPVVNARNQAIAKPSLWQVAMRTSYRPISRDRCVLQIGFSADFEQLSNTGLRYRPFPEMRSGTNGTISLLDTALQPTGTTTTILIAAENQSTIDFELLGIYGPWSGELEYQRAFVTRGYDLTLPSPQPKQGPNLQFSGYHAQVSYILTGESRPIKLSNGTLGQVIPRSKCGAWEVSARYSFISLNDEDINGGLAHNTGVSLCWYINRNLKAITEYIYSKQHRRFTTAVTTPAYNDFRNVQSIGARLQVVF